MRVLLVSANYRPSVGGIERFTELLAGGLAGKGHAVAVLCCRFGHAPLQERDSFDVVRLRSTNLAKRLWGVPYPVPSPVALASQLRRLISSADVVHTQDALYATSAPSLLAAKARHTPSVLTQHVAFVPQRTRLLDAAERAAIGSIGRCSRLASCVVSYNEDVAGWAEATWGLPHVPVLPAGVSEPDADGSDREALRREFGLPLDAFVALFIGRDVAKKRLDVVLGAADPAYEIVAVTDRPPHDSPPGTRILPLMPHDRLERLVLAADAFVLPSHAEGIPLALQEALLAGLPCLVPRLPGYARHFRDDEVRWIEPAAEAIRSAMRDLASDARLHRELGERARAAGRREFGLAAFVDAYERLYEELLTGTRPKAV